MIIEARLTQCLRDHFEPWFLDVTNESQQHNVPPGSESHFKVVLVSDQFVGMRKVQRHQAVYGVVKTLLEGEIHALALHTYSRDEWLQRAAVPESPNCMGGSGQ